MALIVLCMDIVQYYSMYMYNIIILLYMYNVHMYVYNDYEEPYIYTFEFAGQ